MAKKNNWNADAMQGTLISDMEKEVKEGVSQTSALDGFPVENRASVPDGSPSGSQQEPTKGVQTYIRMSDYQRLFTQKMLRDMDTSKNGGKTKTTLAILAAEAISLWLDVQEGKRQVT